MLEVAFSESVAGALKFAAGRKKGQAIEQGAAAVFCDDPAEKERILAKLQEPKTWRGGELDCRAKDVVSLHLQLEYGDLSALETEPAVRLEALQSLYAEFPGVPEELIQSAQSALESILSAQEMRLWIGEQDAGDIIAACWLCHILRGRNVKMHAVYLPAIEQDGDAVVRHAGAGDFEPERLSLEAEKTHGLTPEMQRYMANRFCELKEENAPLRAMVNGAVLSVPEDLYDPALRACVPEGECKLGMIVGRALGSLRAVGDDLLRVRVRRWIAEGVLEEVSPARDENPYSAVVRRGPRWHCAQS
ncbi:MAG: DUF3658 domain-containing protein [Eubacteriales bacterium]|nr:DUF3658 domain-containing protein [Eubacteriales bacterium]